jgi:L-ascorbate metabolism protein UlaG (beta-lactamase superfamily)
LRTCIHIPLLAIALSLSYSAPAQQGLLNRNGTEYTDAKSVHTIRLAGDPTDGLEHSMTLTRVGQSTVLLSMDGHAILTDPWYSERFGYHHGEPIGVPLADLPKLSVVLISHGHYDHFDMKAFRAYPDKSVLMVLPRGLKAKAIRAGFTNVREVAPGDVVRVAGLAVTVVPAKHGVPEVTYVLQDSAFTVYFGGDTLLIDPLVAALKKFSKLDLALLPVNGLTIRPKHQQVVMTPEEAATLCANLSPEVAVPIHYSFTGGAFMDTFVLKHTGTAQQFVRDAGEKCPDTKAMILAPGEMLRLIK